MRITARASRWFASWRASRRRTPWTQDKNRSDWDSGDLSALTTMLRAQRMRPNKGPGWSDPPDRKAGR